MLKLNVNSPENGHQAQYDYETTFAKKIELAKGFPNYAKIEKWAQECINAHTGCGYSAIRATVYIDKVNAMTDDEFKQWARSLDYYETPNGLHLLKEWSDYEVLTKKAKAARRLQEELIFEHGKKERDAEYTFGLPYTSSGEFAAVWNCNAEARKRDSRAYLAGIAISTEGKPVAFYKIKDENGNEVGDLFEEVAK